MKKVGVNKAELELEAASKGWQIVRAAWDAEVKLTMSEFVKAAQYPDTRRNVHEAGRVWSDFVNSTNSAHTLQNLNEARRGWSVFLEHVSRVFSKLEQSSKVGSSQPWYGTIKHQRKKDPLLQYIYQARDASRHGDVLLGHDTIVQGVSASVRVYITPESLAAEGETSGSHLNLPKILLLPVKTRSGTYMPPRKHLGKDINPLIDVVAEATLAFLAQTIAAAKSRIED